MSRRQRYCPDGLPVHVIQRGNNRNDCFVSEQDKATYAGYLAEASLKYFIDVHAWVMMSNHVHLLVTPQLSNGVSRFMQYLGGKYVRYFNRRHERTGTLWEGRFRSCLVQADHYFLTCQRYIELNPVRAGMVQHPAGYHWSSYSTNALGHESNICRPHPVYLSLGNTDLARLQAYRMLFDDVIPEKQLEEIRESINGNRAFGSDAFIRMIEDLGGQRIRRLKRGPKARSE